MRKSNGENRRKDAAGLDDVNPGMSPRLKPDTNRGANRSANHSANHSANQRANCTVTGVMPQAMNRKIQGADDERHDPVSGAVAAAFPAD
ncbi:hypothetical protein PQR62_10925 [Herbaspirillum lusitanum]|uniref:Uncharacterized protein n=1 Tax=Herbaspirillum lusitanum TaxID=213312 RepID=A0ABW9A9W5_9BURK